MGSQRVRNSLATEQQETSLGPSAPLPYTQLLPPFLDTLYIKYPQSLLPPTLSFQSLELSLIRLLSSFNFKPPKSPFFPLLAEFVGLQDPSSPVGD